MDLARLEAAVDRLAEDRDGKPDVVRVEELQEVGRLVGLLELQWLRELAPDRPTDEIPPPGAPEPAQGHPASFYEPRRRPATSRPPSSAASFSGTENMGQWPVGSSRNDHWGPARAANQGWPAAIIWRT
jgi:hypothetical protein